MFHGLVQDRETRAGVFDVLNAAGVKAVELVEQALW